MKQTPAAWKIVLFAGLAGPLITALAVGVISSIVSMTTDISLSGALQLLKTFYLIGAVPAFTGGLLFALMRRFWGSGRFAACLSGFLGVSLPALIITADGSITAFLEAVKLAAFLGIIPALITHLAAEKILGWHLGRSVEKT